MAPAGSIAGTAMTAQQIDRDPLQTRPPGDKGVASRLPPRMLRPQTHGSPRGHLAPDIVSAIAEGRHRLRNGRQCKSEQGNGKQCPSNL